MICAILLELAGVRCNEIEADYTATESADPADGRQMLEHVDAEHGSIAGYAQLLGLGREATAALRRLLR